MPNGSERKVKWYVNINKHTVGNNARNDKNDPPIRVSKGKSGKGEYYHRVSLPADSAVVYSPLAPILKCGARVVIECDEEPKGYKIDV